MKKICITIILCLTAALTTPATASHILGGELTYTCLGNGFFKFKFIVYAQCNGLAYPDTIHQLRHNSVPGLPSSISLNLLQSSEISPVCAINIITSCQAPVPPNSIQGVKYYEFESMPIDFANVPAPPSNTPYFFFVSDVPCCRNTSDNTMGCPDATFSASMYQYKNTDTNIPISPAQLCDNSPQFATLPDFNYIQHPNDTVNINSYATDDRTDSLVYSIDYPGTDSIYKCGYTGGYTLNNPFPNIIKSNNSPINQTTGIIKFKPLILGFFLCNVSVESWRCGQKISQVQREIIFLNTSTPPNYPTPQNPQDTYAGALPPTLSKPFGTGDGYSTQVFVNDPLSFYISASDFDRANFQKVKLFFADIFGNGYNPNTLCPAPCPTLIGTGSNLNSLPQPMMRRTIVEGYGFVGTDTLPNGSIVNTGSASANFVWVPTCANIPPCENEKTYIFNATAEDDQCPTPNRISRGISIKVMGKPVLKKPTITAQTRATNGQMTLQWTQDFDSITVYSTDINLAQSFGRRVASFVQYNIYRAANVLPLQFYLIDSVPQPTTLQYTDATATPTDNYTYIVATVSGCNAQKSFSTSIVPVATQNIATEYDFKVRFDGNTKNIVATYTLPQACVITMNLIDYTGKTISAPTDRTHQKLNAGTHTAQIDATQLPTGIYLLSVGIGNKKQGFKVSIGQ
jgi:hypothetical protein